MAAPNSNYTEIITSTIESRSGVVADNVTKNNAILSELKKKGRIKPFSGGRTIIQELSYAENGNGQWFSGYDTLTTGASDVLSAPEFAIKQYAVPVVMSGLEMLQNSGKEAILDLMEERLAVAEATMANAIAAGLYADGTGSGGKEITGLEACVSADPTTGTYGGINRATAGNEFWRHQLNDVTISTSNASGEMMELLVACTRGADRPDLIMVGNQFWSDLSGQLQPLQRFTNPDKADVGFSALDFAGIPVILDGGIGGNADTDDAYFLNTKYLHFRPHSKMNMNVMGPERRYAVNQDAVVTIMGWAGNLTCSGSKFQGRLKGD